MKVKHLLLSFLAATSTAICLTLPALAQPATLVGSQPGSRVNVRSAPSTQASSPHYGLVGDRVEILRQTKGSDGATWYYVQFASGAEGWVRGNFVRAMGNGGSRAVLTGAQSGSRVNVRSAPSTQASSPHYGLVGDSVRVLRSTQGRDGYRWFLVRFTSGAEGWVRGDFVEMID